MNRFTSFILLALLAGSPIITPIAQAQTQTAQVVAIGWTKAQVQKSMGKPTRTSQDGNTWYYAGKRLTIQFTNGKVSGFPGAAG